MRGRRNPSSPDIRVVGIDIFSGGGPVCVVAGEFGVRVSCEVVYMAVEVSGDCHIRDA